MTRASAVERSTISPVSVERTVATPSRHPRMQADVIEPAARLREALAQRSVGGAVEEPAGDDGGGGHDRHLVAGLGEVERPSRGPASR